MNRKETIIGVLIIGVAVIFGFSIGIQSRNSQNQTTALYKSTSPIYYKKKIQQPIIPPAQIVERYCSTRVLIDSLIDFNICIGKSENEPGTPGYRQCHADLYDSLRFCSAGDWCIQEAKRKRAEAVRDNPGSPEFAYNLVFRYALEECYGMPGPQKPEATAASGSTSSD
jgi:hypothetical protein